MFGVAWCIICSRVHPCSIWYPRATGCMATWRIHWSCRQLGSMCDMTLLLLNSGWHRASASSSSHCVLGLLTQRIICHVAHTHAHTHMKIPTRTHINIYAHTCNICINMHTHIHMHTCMQTHTCTHTQVDNSSRVQAFSEAQNFQLLIHLFNSWTSWRQEHV